MLTRIVRMTFQPQNVADFLAIFRDSENKIRNMPGCRHLELWQDADAPHVYCTHSRWDSATDLDNYRRSALFGQVWPATKKLFAAPPLAFSVYPAGPVSPPTSSPPLPTT